MKRTLVGIVLAGLYATASAQGYAGALIGMADFGINCKGLTPCDTDGKALKLYAGTRFKNGLVNTSRFKLDTLEVSFLRFQGAKAFTGNRVDNLGLDFSTGEEIILTRPMEASASAKAITLAGVGRFEITPRFSASTKAGIAYVNSTISRTIGGLKTGSETTSKFKPYVGLGVEFSVINNLRIVGSYDYTKFDSDGFSGKLQMYGIGAEYGF